MGENNKPLGNETPLTADEKLEKLTKKRKAKSRKPWIIFLCILLSLLLVLCLVPQILLNYYIGLIEIDDQSTDDTEEYVNIDDESFNQGEYVESGWDMSDFSDPEDTSWNPDNGDTSTGNGSGNNSGNGSGGSGGSGSTGGYTDWMNQSFSPDYEIIEGLFDGNNVSEEYDKDVINIMLIGLDTNGGKGARSDTMILMSINNVKKRITLTSIMRDCYVPIPGYKDNKINAAHAAGGPDLLKKTVKQNFDINIDYYVRIGFVAFKQAVDAIGGIDLTVNDINYNWVKKTDLLPGQSLEEAKGKVLHLSGGLALNYARDRSYGSADFVRTQHQRDLVSQTITSLKNKSLTDIHTLLQTVLPYVKTDMPKDVLKSMVWNVLDYVSYNVETARVPCSDSFRLTTIRRMSVIELNIPANAQYLKAVIYG